MRPAEAAWRGALVGAAVCGVIGALVGLVLGLRAYAPTAWAAVVEVGVPAALAGAVLGTGIGLVVSVVAGRVRHRS